MAARYLAGDAGIEWAARRTRREGAPDGKVGFFGSAALGCVCAYWTGALGAGC